MGFDTEGFIGVDALRIVDEQRMGYPDLFTFADECSLTAMKTALLHLDADNREVSVRVMFARCIAQYQGAIILAERGLPIESMLLTRALYETDFVLGALANKMVTPEKLVESDFSSRKKIGNVLLPIAKKENPLEHHEKLAAFIEENAEATSISIVEMAQRAGMQLVYDGMYRYLSHFSAHPSVSAASEYFVEQAGGNGHVVFRPLVSETPKSILAACSGILLACGAFEKAAQTNSEINTEIKTRLEFNEVLYEKYRPWDIKD